LQASITRYITSILRACLHHGPWRCPLIP
jgi:hypothetical protein